MKRRQGTLDTCAALVLATCLLLEPLGQRAAADQPAKRAFGAQALPAEGPPKSVGFYSKGCMAGAVAIPVDGQAWQVMRLSRNRRWGHPALIRTIEQLSVRARRDGWNGLMVGDISQPRGGPMLTGHASHQIGLDADLWFMPMPDKRLTYEEREALSAVSVLKENTNFVDERRWTKAHEMLLKHAAAFGDVERILVHPGVKKKLCDSVRGDRSWLAKIRPFYGHHYHFHLRLGCQDGSPACKKQAEVAAGEGCDASLDWWFKVALAPRKKKSEDETGKPPRPLMVSQLPAACAQILEAPATPPQQAEYRVREPVDAPAVDIPKYDPARALASRPIEEKGPAIPLTTAYTASQPGPAAPLPSAEIADGSADADGDIPVPVRNPRK